MRRLFLLSVFIISLAEVSFANPPKNIKHTNITGTQFSISWITDGVGTCAIKYGTNTTNLNKIVDDDRGENVTDDVHHFTIMGLVPKTTYYYDIISGRITYDNSGKHYSITTGPDWIPPPPEDYALGTITKLGNPVQDGSCIVYLRLEEKNTNTISAEKSMLVSHPEGIWITYLNQFRKLDLTGKFEYSTNSSQLIIFAEGSGLGVGGMIIDITEPPLYRPAPDLELGTDTAPPYIYDTQPSAHTIQNVNTNVTLHLRDTGYGVGSNTIVMKINDRLVTPLLMGSPQDYYLFYDPPKPFEFGKEVKVNIYAQDLAPNPNILDTSYTFTTTADITSPTISQRSPAKNATEVHIYTNIVISIQDTESGIATSTIIMEVEGERISPQIGGNLPTYCSLTYKPVVDFKYGQEVNVYLEVKDNASNTLKEAYTFTTTIDAKPPKTSAHTPAKNETNVPIETPILFNIIDEDSGVASSTILFKLNGATITSYSLNEIPQGYSFYYDPIIDFDYGQIVEISLEVEDLAFVPNKLIENYTFTTTKDTIPPKVIYRSPDIKETQVPVETDITIYLRDDETGINKDSIVMFVNEENVTRKLIITGTKTEYVVNYNPPINFEYNQVIKVRINANDLANNSMPQDMYTFTTKLDGLPPYVSDQYPAKGTTSVKIDTQIMFHLKDNESGINKDTFIFFVEGIDVTSQVAFFGTKSDYHILYQPKTPFDYNQEVNIMIKITDFGSNTIEESYSFTTEQDTICPMFSDHNPAKEATEIERNTNIMLVIKDDESGINADTIIMKVNDVQVAIITTPITLLKTYLITYNPQIDFGYNEVVKVYLEVKDKANNIATETYTFTTTSDKNPPYTTEHYPAKEAIDVPIDTPILFNICDNESGVKRESILLQINNATITTMSIFYTLGVVYLRYDPIKPFSFGEVVEVYIRALDFANNILEGTYTFTTLEDKTPPYTSGYTPLPNATNTPINTDIVLHIEDSGVGVDISSIIMKVNNLQVFPTIIPPAQNYTLIYRPSGYFNFNEVVTVSVGAKDLAGNTMPTVIYTFTTTIDTLAPYITDPIPPPEATQIAVDTNISLHIKDNGAGVDINSIMMKVDDKDVTPLVSGGSQDYTLFYNPTYNFEANKRICVYIKASDLASSPNILETEYFFTTIDTAKPYTTDHTPPKDSTTSTLRPTISFHIKDDSMGIDIATIKVIINGATVTSNYKIEGTTKDYIFTYRPPTDFASNHTVWITVSAEDFVGNKLEEVYSFFVSDTMPPYTTEHKPARGTIGVSPNIEIEFHIKDTATGVNKDSIKVWINENKITGLNISGNIYDYLVKYKPAQPFRFGEIVTVTIEANDLATPSNLLQQTYTFTITTDDTPPYVLGHIPAKGTTNVSVNTTMMYHLRDDISGVDILSIKIWINGHKIDGLNISGNPFDYTVVYKPPQPFNFGEIVTVAIEAVDLAFVPNRMPIECYTFTTKVDNEPPILLWVTGEDSTHLKVFFEDENPPMKNIDKRNFFIYESNAPTKNIEIYLARLDGDKNVTLITDILKNDIFYTLVVNNITDAARNPILPPNNKCEFSLKGNLEGIIEKEDKTKVEFLPYTFYKDISTIEIHSLSEIATVTHQANESAKQDKEIRNLIPNTTREFIARKPSGSETLASEFRASPKITIPYPPSSSDQEEKVFYRIYQLIENRWVLVPGKQEVDVVNNTVSTNVAHFGIYRLGAATPSPQLPPNKLISGIEVFPNPFKPSKGHSFISFRNFAGAITIRIFNIAGELMRTLEVKEGAPQPYIWDVKDEDGKDLATGIYIYVITNFTQDKVTGKVSIIR